MDTVTVFNTELSGLYDTKPPISKAKMASITRGAMKAIKFYKHVVQSVEKFILKCKPEYKVPGLYVIDSIVRQSRHQFGAEKDVFAPRFARNMQTTFANLFRCTPEDKSKIIRVLNLWQKNSVFAPEVIQPLFDLADPNHPIYQTPNMCQNTDISANNITMNSLSHSNIQESPPTNINDEGHTMSSDMSGPIAIPTPSQLDSSTIRQLQQLQQFLLRQTSSSDTTTAGTSGGGGSSGAGAPVNDSVKFNKKLLDYDYGEDEEEEKPQTPRPQNVENNNISQLLNDPNVIRQLQTLQKLKQQEEKQTKLTEMRLQEEAFEKHLATVLKKLPFANECDLSRSNNDQNQIFGMQTNINNLLQQSAMNINQEHHTEPEVELVSDDGKVEVINLDANSRSPSIERDRYTKRRRSRTRSRDRSGGRRRRSRSRSRSPRSRRRSSRDRDRDRVKDKEREREKEREYERERRKKGLPDIKREHLSVCSTTLWVGHLSKLVQQEELSDTFMKYGDIVSIDMIHPRGCAFIVMNRRQDAYKAMGGLKNYKLQGRIITISWAAGKGVKSKEWKDYWDLDLGVSYIPWTKLEPTTDFDSLEEGGMFDEDSMPGWLKEKMKASNQKKDQSVAPNVIYPIPDINNALDTTQPPPAAPQMLPNVPIVPPFPMGPVPRLMPPMGMHMPPNIVPGLPLGVPPPQINPSMMLPGGGMVPTLSHPLPIDKSVPPPSAGTATAFIGHFPPPMPGPIPSQIPPQHMPPAQMPSVPTVSITNNNNNSDDHMDIEMDDEPSTRIANNQTINTVNVGPFNRPPPQMFAGQHTAPSPPPLQNFMSGKESHDSQRDRRRDRSGSRDRRSRDRDRDFRSSRDKDRDVRSRDRDRSDRDRDRRSDYNRDRDRNSRWGSDRGRSRENDMPHRDRRNSRERERNTRDRNDRDKSLQDRLRDIASENSRGDFSRRGGESNDWRDGSSPAIGAGNMPPGMFIDQGIRNIRPLNIGPMGGPPPLSDLMHNARGPPPPPNHRDFDYPRDEFDRRGPPRDFFPPNRFGPPGQVPRGMPMGMMRVGPPQFGPRLGGPLFLRGNRPGPGHAGLPGAGFNDRQFFDRDGNAGGMRGGRGMNDNRRGGMIRSNWNDRSSGGSGGGSASGNGGGGVEDDQKPSNRFAAQKDDVTANIKQDDNKRSSVSRWSGGNASPKSDVSDEENWDDEEPEQKSNKPIINSLNNNSNITNSNINNKTELVPLPQTEPIDDDSQEDDFNDFDENAPDVNDVNDLPNKMVVAQQLIENVHDEIENECTDSKQQSFKNAESFDMFANTSPTPPMPPKFDSNEFLNASNETIYINTNNTSTTTTTNDIQNTTPLYDELQDDSQNKTELKLYNDNVDDNHDSRSAITNETDREPEIPGIDPDEGQQE